MTPVPPPVHQPWAAAPPKKSNTVLIVVIVLLVLFCVIVPIIGALVFPVFSQARLSAMKSASMMDARAISQALLMYAADNDETLPPSFSSSFDLQVAAGMYASGRLNFESNNPLGGEFIPNPYLTGAPLSRVFMSQRSVLLYDSMTWESGNGHIVGYADGSAAFVPDFSDFNLPVAILSEDPTESP